MRPTRPGPWTEQERALHLLCCDIDDAVDIALNKLARHGFVESTRMAMWSARHWRITRDGREWLQADYVAFTATINDGLAGLAVVNLDGIE